MSKIPKRVGLIAEDESDIEALKELIKKCPLSANNILVFDTGLQARATF